MTNSAAGSPLKSSWRARGLPPSIAAEVERRDWRLKRRVRWTTVALLTSVGFGAAGYFTAHNSNDTSLVTSALAAGERSYTRIAAIVAEPAKRSLDAMRARTEPVAEPVVSTPKQPASVDSVTTADALPAKRPAEPMLTSPAAPAVSGSSGDTPVQAAATAPVSPAAPPSVSPPVAIQPTATPASDTPPPDPVIATTPATLLPLATSMPAPVATAVPAAPAPVVVAALAPPVAAAIASAPVPATPPPVTPAAAVPAPLPPPCTAQVATAARQTVIWFEIGSAEISLGQSALIARLAAELVSCPAATLEIGGHTDTVGIDNNNFALSWRRAEAVRALLESGGVAPGRLVPIGYGTREPMPVAKTASTKDVNQLNRRVELKLR